MTKPFIAARIPQIIENKLQEYGSQHGMSKTEILINALAQYLGCSIEVPVESKAIDRLEVLESQVLALTERLDLLSQPKGKPVQKSLF